MRPLLPAPYVCGAAAGSPFCSTLPPSANVVIQHAVLTPAKVRTWVHHTQVPHGSTRPDSSVTASADTDATPSPTMTATPRAASARSMAARARVGWPGSSWLRDTRLRSTARQQDR
eukprot:350158-Chlamydomonas_euryale.AAC.5